MNSSSYLSYDTENASGLCNPYTATIITSQSSNIRLISEPKSQKLVIYNAVDKKFELLDFTRESIAQINGNLHVISNSGKPRAGKSTMLNIIVHLLSYLDDHQSHHQDEESKSEDHLDKYSGFKQLFKVGNGDSSTTEGLDYFCLKYGSAHILFLDLEGNDDPKRKEKGKWIYSNFINIALAVSHIHLYNYKDSTSADFLKYFRDTQTIIKQRKLHSKFGLQVYAVKKDDRSNGPNVTREIILDEMKTDLHDSGVGYDAYLINSPPDHLFRTCMNSEASICDACKKSSYIEGVEDLAVKILDHLRTMTPYSSGQEFLSTLDSILLTNERELPYMANDGDHASMEANRLKDEELRIKNGLANAFNSAQDREFSQSIVELFRGKSVFVKAKELEDFRTTLTLVFHKLPQLEFLLDELSKFVARLLDKNTLFSVLNQDNAGYVVRIYIGFFITMMKEVLQAFNNFQRLLEYVGDQVGNLKNDFHNHLSKYVRALNYNKAQNMAVAIPSLSAPVLGLIARDVATKAVAWGFAGMAAMVGVVALYAYIEAKNKFAESKREDCNNLNIQCIPGLSEGQDEKAQMEVVENYLKKMAESSQQKSTTLRELLQHGTPDEKRLKRRVEKMLDRKLKGVEFREKDEQKLKELLIKVQDKVRKLSNCI